MPSSIREETTGSRGKEKSARMSLRGGIVGNNKSVHGGESLVAKRNESDWQRPATSSCQYTRNDQSGQRRKKSPAEKGTGGTSMGCKKGKGDPRGGKKG